MLHRLHFRLCRPRLSLKSLPAPGGRLQFLEAPALRGPRMLSETQVRFLNEEGDCGNAQCWNAPDRPKLWLYNLHYFEDLSALGADVRIDWHKTLIRRWMAENPPTKGNGWEPYPTSLRIVHWVRWAMTYGNRPMGFFESLALQARWLRRRLEYHLLANHLVANGKALVFAGVLFEGKEAEEWLVTGVEILSRQFGEQVLRDGGHYERSPLYHSIVLEDLLDLINLSEGSGGVIPEKLLQDWREVAGRMLGWLDDMTHPDGEIAQFNDAAFSIAPSPSELRAYGSRLAIASSGGAALQYSGYGRYESGPAALLVDAAPVGPDEQPGHAHADSLSFELSVFGARFVVNTGTSTYEPSEERKRERSTAAHNTVELEGENSSEVWGTFRVARRARILNAECNQRGDTIFVRASHDGYTRLTTSAVHSREWRLSPSCLKITDRVTGGYQKAIGRLHFHPNVRVEEGYFVHFPESPAVPVIIRWKIEGATTRIRTSYWAPEFGRRTPTTVLEYQLDNPVAVLELNWGSDA